MGLGIWDFGFGSKIPDSRFQDSEIPDSEVRNPKSQIPNPKIRNPKSEIPNPQSEIAMRSLSSTSHQLIEAFFREHLGDAMFELPKTYIAAGRVARVAAAALRIQGITIGPLVFIAPALLERTGGRITLPRDLVVHEIAHVVQYRRHGFFGFLWKYFGDYLRNIRKQGNWSAKSRHAAYLAIPFEIEARQTAYEFVRWFANRRNSGLTAQECRSELSSDQVP
ncbi:MAG: DUF4157 domain-containing protein [Acidobacteria bacterium]|nr:DUF4157 domain-containing protein [Acidobacteriota bacterium]